MIDDLTRNILEQRTNIENQNNRILNSNMEHYIKQLEQRIENAIELNKQIKSFVYNEMVERCVPGSTELYDLVKEELKVLGGNNEKNKN